MIRMLEIWMGRVDGWLCTYLCFDAGYLLNADISQADGYKVGGKAEVYVDGWFRTMACKMKKGHTSLCS